MRRLFAVLLLGSVACAESPTAPSAPIPAACQECSTIYVTVWGWDRQGPIKADVVIDGVGYRVGRDGAVGLHVTPETVWTRVTVSAVGYVPVRLPMTRPLSSVFVALRTDRVADGAEAKP